jgi:tetratricopeptide (TPR) repeat protein
MSSLSENVENLNEDENSEQEEAEESSSSDDDDGGDLILLARITESRRPKPQAIKSKVKKLENVSKFTKEEIQLQKQEQKERIKKQNLSKAEKRLLFSLDSLKVADSHVISPSSAAGQQTSNPLKPATEADDADNDDDVDMKALLKQGYDLSQQRKSKEAIPVLKKTLKIALKRQNLQAALSATSLLASELLQQEQTREAIELFHQAISIAQKLGPNVVNETQQKSLIAALQNAYKNVGDIESAKEVPNLYGPEFFNVGSTATTSTAAQPIASSTTTLKPLTPDLVTALNTAIEQGVMNKDLQSLKYLLVSFSRTPFISPLVQYKHPQTGITALHVASGRDDAAMVNELVNFGSPLSEKDISGATPLLWAARFGAIQALDELFRAGARFDEDLSEEEIAKWPNAVKQRVASMVNNQ